MHDICKILNFIMCCHDLMIRIPVFIIVIVDLTLFACGVLDLFYLCVGVRQQTNFKLIATSQPQGQHVQELVPPKMASKVWHDEGECL